METKQIFIKTGYWTQTKRPYNGWLNLSELLATTPIVAGTLAQVLAAGNTSTLDIVLQDTGNIEFQGDDGGRIFREDNYVEGVSGWLTEVWTVGDEPNLNLRCTDGATSSTTAIELTPTSINVYGGFKLSVYTVATLPSTPQEGTKAFVNDATATTFHSIVAGTGANFVPVFYDGTDWRIG